MAARRRSITSTSTSLRSAPGRDDAATRATPSASRPSGVASLVGLFYYGYAPFSLVAGVGHGPARPPQGHAAGRRRCRRGRAACSRPAIPTLAASAASCRAAGGVFALIGAVYIATTYLPASHAATLIGAHPDVRHGRRIGRPVPGGPGDRWRPRLGPASGCSSGVAGAVDRGCAVCSDACAARPEARHRGGGRTGRQRRPRRW